ncbi:MAG: glycosyltransferase family 2 protein [Planctomyces sp.]|nr:glycosyltransferase family 2 protein [Planctomyces sp.]
MLRECACRQVLAEQNQYFCQHPGVIVRNGLVTSSMCRTCPYVDQPRPASARTWEQSRNSHSLLTPFSVGVVIPCHNYGRYVGDAIESALAQTVRPAEILVIVDRSDDDSWDVASSYADRNVRVLSVDYGNVHDVRRRGFEETTSSILCFLDADDRLGPEYIERGLAEFTADQVAIVYSDMQQFGSSSAVRRFPGTFSRASLHQQNFIHAGSLIRRDALELTDAFLAELDAITSSCTGDWWLWKRLAACGWTARKQSGMYYYRRHSESALARNARGVSYFESAWLARELLTLFVPLSGRELLWPQMAAFLEEQQWPHNQVRLILFDTSQNPKFSETIRRWIQGCDYSDVRHVQQAVGTRRLADLPRRESAAAVRRSMAKIYNFLKEELSTDLVWILEDDILPPRDVALRLLEQFDGQTVSVAAPYRSRYESAYVVWDSKTVSYTSPLRGATEVGGNGFGCVLIRSGVIQEAAFSHAYRLPDFDRAFYAQVQSRGLVAKVLWDVECQHFASEENPGPHTLGKAAFYAGGNV